MRNAEATSFSEQQLVVNEEEVRKFPPVKNLTAETFYSDKNASVIDQERFEAYQNAVAPLDDFIIRLAKSSNAFSLDNNIPEGVLSLTLLDAWAKEDALLGHWPTFQSKASRVWYGFSLSANYIQVKPLCKTAPPTIKCKRIEKWLDRIHLANISYIGRIQKNNILYWTAAGARLTGHITNNIMLTHWGKSRLKRGWRDVKKNGTMAAEIKRGKRAAFYHAFALTALTWGTAVDGPKALQDTLENTPNARLLLSLVSDASQKKFQTITDVNGVEQDLIDYPFWLMPWAVNASVENLPSVCVLRAHRFHKTFAGKPEALLLSIWSIKSGLSKCSN